MAVDAALLESALHEGTCTLRCYQWAQPTLSLGYFQSADSLPAAPELANLPVVRRLSGGGAIVHHHELTYSCAIPPSHPLAADPFRLYTLVHHAFIEILRGLGVPAALRGTARPEKSTEFLCFGRGDDFDVVVAGHKVLGSAQRRRKGAILQHGSLVLARSDFSPAFPGLSDLAGHEISPACLLALATEALPPLFGEVSTGGCLTQAERERAALLEPTVVIRPLPEPVPPSPAATNRRFDITPPE